MINLLITFYSQLVKRSYVYERGNNKQNKYSPLKYTLKQLILIIGKLSGYGKQLNQFCTIFDIPTTNNRCYIRKKAKAEKTYEKYLKHLDVDKKTGNFSSSYFW